MKNFIKKITIVLLIVSISFVLLLSNSLYLSKSEIHRTFVVYNIEPVFEDGFQYKHSDYGKDMIHSIMWKKKQDEFVFLTDNIINNYLRDYNIMTKSNGNGNFSLNHIRSIKIKVHMKKTNLGYQLVIDKVKFKYKDNYGN
jgi:hypothetical protein